MSESNLAITKQAIGRHGFIGSLYDIRSDQFEGGNLFNRELASSFISTTDFASSNYFVDENTSQKETLEKLNVEGSLQLSLMVGLVKVDGSAKYLNQTKTDSQTVRVTLMFNVTTKQQHLHVSMADLCNYFTPDALENSNATHCVTGITWGARVAATFEETLENSTAAKELQGKLSASLITATKNIKGEAKLENVDQANSKLHSMKICFSGDVLINDVPNTLADVFNIFTKVPSMLKELNEGKGKQLEFQLYPLKRMAEIFKYELRIEKRIIKEVASHMVYRIENIFEEINKGKRTINDFLAKIEVWKEWIPSNWTDVIHVHQRKLMDVELETQHRIKSLLEEIRRGKGDEQDMINLLNNFSEENPCSVKSVDQFLKANARINAKINALSRFDRNTIETGLDSEPKTPNTDLLLKEISSIDDFIYNYSTYDVYLLHISHKWEEKDKANWHKQLRYFINLQKGQMKTDETKSIFRVIDHDLHPDLDEKPETCVIYHVSHGDIQSKNYYHSSLTTLSPQQIRAIRIENKFAALSDTEIEDTHTKFINAHSSGEIDEPGLIKELQERYPKGDPKHYCNFLFKTIDKDKSGTLNFTEFMSAISLKLEGNIDKQLDLVFSMCSYGTSNEVGSEELIQFLEATAELEGGYNAINSKAAKTSVEELMKLCNKENNEKITKDEFITGLKENNKLCVAFLPIAVHYQQAAASESGQSLSPPPPVKYLTCGGQACSTCNGCCDWHRVDSHWSLTNGGKCTASRTWIYLHVPSLCNCKTYY